MPQVDVVALARVHPVDDLFFPKKTILISHQLLRHVPAWYCHKVFGGDRCRYVNAWLPITSKFSASCCAPSTIHRPQLKTILLNASPCQIPSSSNILQQLLDPLSDTLVRPCISRRPPISYYPASTIFQKLQVLDRKKSQWRKKLPLSSSTMALECARLVSLVMMRHEQFSLPLSEDLAIMVS